MFYTSQRSCTWIEFTDSHSNFTWPFFLKVCITGDSVCSSFQSYISLAVYLRDSFTRSPRTLLVEFVLFCATSSKRNSSRTFLLTKYSTSEPSFFTTSMAARANSADPEIRASSSPSFNIWWSSGPERMITAAQQKQEWECTLPAPLNRLGGASFRIVKWSFPSNLRERKNHNPTWLLVCGCVDVTHTWLAFS